eukprot:XP_017453323.1 PREDICTED: uncharacterized protein LOC108352198 isoform X2 [Rattus norvegicus]
MWDQTSLGEQRQLTEQSWTCCAGGIAEWWPQVQAPPQPTSSGHLHLLVAKVSLFGWAPLWETHCHLTEEPLLFRPGILERHTQLRGLAWRVLEHSSSSRSALVPPSVAGLSSWTTFLPDPYFSFLSLWRPLTSSPTCSHLLREHFRANNQPVRFCDKTQSDFSVGCEERCRGGRANVEHAQQ